MRPFDSSSQYIYLDSEIIVLAYPQCWTSLWAAVIHICFFFLFFRFSIRKDGCKDLKNIQSTAGSYNDKIRNVALSLSPYKFVSYRRVSNSRWKPRRDMSVKCVERWQFLPYGCCHPYGQMADLQRHGMRKKMCLTSTNVTTTEVMAPHSTFN